MLRWNVANARVEERHGARMITKPSVASVGPEKIDGVIALVMAVALSTEESSRPSVYERRGILML